MQFVYILQSDKDKGFYIGCADNVTRRLENHQKGLVDSTKHRRPWQLIYYEAYQNKFQAFEREQKLKQFGSSYNGLLKRLKIK